MKGKVGETPQSWMNSSVLDQMKFELTTPKSL